MAIKLYCFGESGNAYKAALTFELSGLEWEPVYVDFFKGEARSERYREEINEMGEVPVMIDGDTKISQSAVIQNWAAERAGTLMPDTIEERREVLRWQFFDNHKLSTQAGTVRFLKNFLPEDKRPDPAVTDFLTGRLKSALKVLETHLTGRDWIVGRHVSVADLSCCSYLYYDEPFGFDRSDYPAIDGWLTRISDLSGWAHPYDLMPRALGGTT